MSMRPGKAWYGEEGPDIADEVKQVSRRVLARQRRLRRFWIFITGGHINLIASDHTFFLD